MSELAPAVVEQLKAGQRSLWTSGDYPKLSAELFSELGRTLVEACGVCRGQRVLDVAAGAGNVALPAAQAGAEVVASDLTPELFDAGRRLAAERGVGLEWVEADAEALPFGDGEFDTVLVLHRRDVRPAAPAGRGRAAAGVPAGRHPRADQLEAVQFRRPAVRHHLPPTSRRHRPAPSPPCCGATRSTSRRCSGTGSATWSRSGAS
ncbi:MAG TPA: class I SAM-dependent methyltransferase [Pseudonocardiaceae bacterium]|nr:class I SAM-dependent methyltransferase [Pseudonocardiaceae bacterium]